VGWTVLTKIRLRGVHKSFAVEGRRVPVLQGVDFHALEGELVSVIGPSGCGKSTLLNTIAGLEQPDGGTVELDGRPSGDRLGMVGYMQQKDLLMPWRSVLDNAILGLEIGGVHRGEARRRALELVDAFGLRGFENQYPHALSGGMRQRAAFLRTVLVNRDVMLLDEPFGALDALTRTQMQEWLLGLWGLLGKTIVLVTHDVDEALLLSDRVYVMTARPGKVKTVVDVDLRRPRYYGMTTDARFTALKGELILQLREEERPVGQESRR
jgi:ABC-type nitrate/sulfonate/bicarbonate transport system ATPase subunit